MPLHSEKNVDDVELVLTMVDEPRPTSMRYLLPAAMQNGMLYLPSLRRSISGLRTRGNRHKSSNSVPEMSRPITPPPGYSTRPGSGNTTPQRQVLSAGEPDLDSSDNELEDAPRADIPPSLPSFETGSGVNWNYARHGVSMVQQARQHARHVIKNDDATTSTLIRSLYIQGLTWLMRGLPSDLTPGELLSIQAATPQAIIDTQDDAGALIARNGTRVESTALSRATAYVVFHVLILIHFVLPYVKVLIGHACEYEREHRITRRVLNTSVATVDGLSRRGMRLAQSICQMNDGRVGEAVNSMMVYSVNGIAGGVQQGIEDALRCDTFRGRPPRPPA